MVNGCEQLSKAPTANRRAYAKKNGKMMPATYLPPLCMFVEVKGPKNL